MVQKGAIVVRLARSDERDGIRELTLSAYAQYATAMEPSTWKALQDAITTALSVDLGAQQIVAEQEGALLGAVMLFPAETEAYGTLGPRVGWPEIRALAVAPRARRLGVARLLLDECLRLARQAGADTIGLHTSQSMREAIRLYETLGFERDPAMDIRVEGAEAVEAYRKALR